MKSKSGSYLINFKDRSFTTRFSFFKDCKSGSYLINFKDRSFTTRNLFYL